MKRFTLFLLLCLLMGCGDKLTGGSSTSGNGAIAITISDSLLQPIEGVTVSLYPSEYTTESNSNFYTTTSNSEGVARFDSLPNDTYTLYSRSESALAAVNHPITINGKLLVSKQVLGVPGTLTISKSSSLLNANFTGTPFQATVNSTDSTITFSDIAPGIYPPLQISFSDGSSLTIDSLQVMSSEELSINPETGDIAHESDVLPSKDLIFATGASDHASLYGSAIEGLWYWMNDTMKIVPFSFSPLFYDTIYDILATPEWAGSGTGMALIRTYSGTVWNHMDSWQSLTDEVLTERTGEKVQAMYIDSANWCWTAFDTAVHYYDVSKSVWMELSGYKDVISFSGSGETTLWMGHEALSGGSISRITSTDTSNFPLPTNEGVQNPRAIQSLGDTLLIGTGSSLFSLYSGVFTKLAPTTGEVVAMHKSGNNTIWVIAQAGYLYEVTPSGSVEASSPTGFAGTFYDMNIVGDTAIHIATGSSKVLKYNIIEDQWNTPSQ